MPTEYCYRDRYVLVIKNSIDKAHESYPVMISIKLFINIVT